MSQYATHADVQACEVSRAMFQTLVEQLADPDGADHATHSELGQLLTTRARELMRQRLQDHLDLRAQREQRLRQVTDAEQVARGSVETSHTRGWRSIRTA